MDDASPAVQVAVAADGTLTYLVRHPPEALPPVRARDLEAAWDAARAAAIRQGFGTARAFRFRRTDGTVTDFALADPDACCWAGAVDLLAGLGTSRGMSLCMRLLALIDLLARARWAAGLFTLRRDGAELDPALITLAATAPLTAEAGFDESWFRTRLAVLGPPCRRASA